MTAPRTVAFSVIDEAVHLLDSEAAPWSIQLELRVAGRLDGTRLGDAFARALLLHPMARARKIPSSRSRHTDRWEIRPEVDVDPLRVVGCADDDDVARVREELQGMAVPLVESPPLRARLVHTPDGDLLMLNANHAAMDGFGALRVLGSVACACAGQPETDAWPDPIEARGRLRELIHADGRTRARRRLALADKLTDVVARPARVAAEGASDEPGYGFHHLALSASLTRTLIDLPHPGTVNDVLLAALHLAVAAWNTRRGKRWFSLPARMPLGLTVGVVTLHGRLHLALRYRHRLFDAEAAGVFADVLVAQVVDLVERTASRPMAS